jgi:hypothetical protein
MSLKKNLKDKNLDTKYIFMYLCSFSGTVLFHNVK